MKLRYTANARNQIDAIHDFIANQNALAATQVVRRIRAAADGLMVFPKMARIGVVAFTHEWVVRGLPYIIVYEINATDDEIVILGVFHGARDRGKNE